MQWKLKKATILYRDPNADQAHEGFLSGDIVEFPDPPFYEVDAITRKCRSGLQCFRVGEGLSLTPVPRGSWGGVKVAIRKARTLRKARR